MSRVTSRFGALLAAVAVLAAGCGSGPAPVTDAPLATTPAASPSSADRSATPSVPRVPTPPPVPTYTPVAPPPPPPVQAPLPVVCPPLPQGGSSSSLSFTGACAFRETRAVPCPNKASQRDDFYIRFTRPMQNGLTMYIDVNVEHYKGPGTYRGVVTVIVEIPDRSTIYEWATTTGDAVIAPDGRSGSFPKTTLPAAAGTPTKGTEYVEGDFRCAG